MRACRGIGKENISIRGPTMPRARPVRFGTRPTWPPRGASDVAAVARQTPLARNVEGYARLRVVVRVQTQKVVT